MKHLVVVTTSFPDLSLAAGQEAAGSFIYDFVEELAHQVRTTVVAPGSQGGTEQVGNLTIRRFAVPSLPLSLLKPSNITQWRSIFNTLRSGQNMVENVVQTSQADRIFALWTLPSGYWAKVAGEKYGVPYSIWALGSDIWSLSKIPLVKNVLKSVLCHSQYRFADGYELANDVKSLSKLDCIFLPSARKLPIQTEKELSTAPPYKLAFLGRWHPHKGIDLLLESLQLLEDADWQNIKMVQICGGGPMEKLVYEKCAWLQRNGRPIIVRGYLNREDATNLLLWADYLLLPSRIESIPVIFSDALQANCPLVANPVGDLPRLMGDGDIGILTNNITAVDLTTAIRQALATAPVEFAEGLRKSRSQFNLGQAVSQLVAQIL